MRRDLPKSHNVLIRVVWLCVISCCFLAVNIEVHAAQQNDPTVESETETKNETVQNQPWKPPPPAPDEFDWIQLKSGEWLKGELKVLYEKQLEFDSDELDLLKFDWRKDVDRVLLSRDKEEKLVNIDLRMGKGPVLTFGYSDGDI